MSLFNATFQFLKKSSEKREEKRGKSQEKLRKCPILLGKFANSTPGGAQHLAP
jgi:hypothetical protein